MIQLEQPKGFYDNEDKELLQTPCAPLSDFTTQDPWRVLRIQGEMVEGFDALSKSLGLRTTSTYKKKKKKTTTF